MRAALGGRAGPLLPVAERAADRIRFGQLPHRLRVPGGRGHVARHGPFAVTPCPAQAWHLLDGPVEIAGAFPYGLPGRALARVEEGGARGGQAGGGAPVGLQGVSVRVRGPASRHLSLFCVG